MWYLTALLEYIICFIWAIVDLLREGSLSRLHCMIYTRGGFFSCTTDISVPRRADTDCTELIVVCSVATA